MLMKISSMKANQWKYINNNEMTMTNDNENMKWHDNDNSMTIMK